MGRLPFFPFIAVLIVVGWQWATVHANYGGNWTALFCTGALRPHPPLVETEHIYIFPNSTGYDGQLYHYVAHDPAMRTNLKDFLDDARLRYRRILMPALAWVLALGRQSWIDPAYELVFLLGIALGVYWSGRFAEHAGLSSVYGLLFLLMPAVPVTMDRLVVDGLLAVFVAGVIAYSEGPLWKLFIVLAAAALTRETGFFLIAACCLRQLLRREFKAMFILAGSAIPAFAWYAYVQARTPPSAYAFSLIPFSGIWNVLMNPWQYPAGTPYPALVHVSDSIALAGVLLAIGFSFLCAVSCPRDPVTIAGALFAALAVVVQRPDHWQNVYDFGRLQTPLLLCLAAVAARERKLWLLTPLAMILPRLAVQFVPQVLGILSLSRT